MIFSLRDPQTAVFVLNSSPVGFFTRPHVNVRSVKPKQITHVGMRQGMFILWPARPLNNSRCRGFAIRIN